MIVRVSVVLIEFQRDFKKPELVTIKCKLEVLISHLIN